MEPVWAILCVAAALAGLALGWLARAGALRTAEGERDRARDELRRAEIDGAAARERAEAAGLLRATLDEVSRERDAAQRDLAAERAGAAARAQGLETRLEEVRTAKEELSRHFGEIGGKLLGDAQRQFLTRAEERFRQSEEKNEAQLKALLNPVEATLKRYEDGLSKVEKERVGSYEALKEAVGQLTQGNEIVRRETQRLANVMQSSPKARGKWGEEHLRNVLIAAGLAENIDFTMQATVQDDGRQLRPDCVVHLPNNRSIVIDVKNVWVAFEQAYDEQDEEKRKSLLKEHVNAMRSTANELGRKSYWRQFDKSPDFVIMFIPGEHVLSAAAERAPDLIEHSFRNGVVLASTINMLALAKLMAGMWRQESLAEQSQAIAEEGRKLYVGLRKVSEHVADVGKGLTRAVSAYSNLVGTIEGSVLTHGKRLEMLKVETGGKTIETLPLIDVAIRPLTKLAGLEQRTQAPASDHETE